MKPFDQLSENLLRALSEGDQKVIDDAFYAMEVHNWSSPRIPIRVRGVTYENADIAARMLGVTPQTIYSALSRGTLDTVAMHIRTHHRGGKPPEKVTVGPVTFESQTQASRSLGMSRRYVAQALTGGPMAQAKLLKRVMAFVAERDKLKGAKK